MGNPSEGFLRKLKDSPLIRTPYNKLLYFKQWLLYKAPKARAHEKYYLKSMKKPLNLENPKDLNEKLQWCMVNEYDGRFAKYADKYAVREYIEAIGYASILPKIYGAYSNANDIDFDVLPQKFVLKGNHGSGPEYLVICKDKNKLDIPAARRKLNRVLKENFALKQFEYHYADIERRIICEEFLEDKKGGTPADYKIMCFNGRAHSIKACAERDGHDVRFTVFDREWNPLPYIEGYWYTENLPEKPENLEKMLEIAEKISQPFSFARIDLYNIDGKIYFGEITLTPAAGVIHFFTQDSLDLYGDMFDITKPIYHE